MQIKTRKNIVIKKYFTGLKHLYIIKNCYLCVYNTIEYEVNRTTFTIYH